ncbi:hypothetical protein [uncultured Thiothrix sp.]|uniref:hypothetical protein n=1 Tax=uncultured Thiothrix sp. TaxID=223185 RepID=UPI0026264B55|nr:hypothetical protein [uncultured Thiothrix sp.]
MTQNISPALHPEALYTKSKVYASRALRAKTHGDLEEYQLWAAMALELLAKASLAGVHPALVADPTHSESLFAACGVPISPDVKTITAKTLYQRLGHISPKIDHRVQKFCEQLSLRRNSEIHSGESPFAGMSADAWEAKYWYAAQRFLEVQRKDLSEWLGADEAAAPTQLINDSEQAIMMAVRTRIGHLQEDFLNAHKNPKERSEFIAVNESRLAYRRWREFDGSMEGFDLARCPCCGAKGIIGGVLWHEEVSEDTDGLDPWIERVEKTFGSEEFLCEVCNLHLKGRQELQATDLPSEFVVFDDREREFEQEYGND